jgi:hypothetical protein
VQGLLRAFPAIPLKALAARVCVSSSNAALQPNAHAVIPCDDPSMPTLEMLRKLFPRGYSSGNVLSRIPGPRRILEEVRIGASYRDVFFRAILPYIAPDSKVLELGPGSGSWTRAILKHVPRGEVHTVDFQDVRGWIHPEPGSGRLCRSSWSQRAESNSRWFCAHRWYGTSPISSE